MKLKKDEIMSCLGVIEKALPVRSPIPIINNIYFHCREKDLLFSATNAELEISCVLNCPGERNFKLLLPPKIIDITRYLPEQNVDITFDVENHAIDISSGQINCSLYGADPAEYPTPIDVLPEYEYITIDQATLKQALRQVVFATSIEEGRPVFTGLLFIFDRSEITIIASDTYRIAQANIPVPGNSLASPQQLLIPARSIKELIKILGDEEEPVTIGIHKNLVIFHFAGVNMVCKVLDEKFPDITGVIPPSFQSRLEIPRKELEETVTRVSLLAEGINKAVCFSSSDSRLQVSASSQVGRMEDSLVVKTEGEDFEIYLNSRFLLEMIKSVDYEMFSVEFNGQNGPVIFKPKGKSDYLYLVLPIKMTQESA